MISAKYGSAKISFVNVYLSRYFSDLLNLIKSTARNTGFLCLLIDSVLADNKI